MTEMKHSIFSLWIRSCVLLFAMLCAGGCTSLWAQKSTSRATLEKQRKTAERQIAETSSMLQKTNKSAIGQLNELKILNSEIDTRRVLLLTLNKELEEIQREQRTLQSNIASLKVNVKGKQSQYANAVRHLYKWRSGYDEFLFILSAKDMFEGVRRMRYLQEYSNWRKRQAEELNVERQKVEKAESELQKRKEEQLQLLADQKRQQETLRAKQERQTQLVNDLNKKKKQLQSDLNKQRAQAQALDKKIQQLIEEEARKAALAAAEAKRKRELAAAKKKKNNSESVSANNGASESSSTKYEMSDEDVKLSGTFAQNKGKMPYPVNKPYSIIAHFGLNKTTQYIQRMCNGIELQTKAGAEACAAFDGVVGQIIQVPGSNITVLVRHGGYYTVYSNLSKVYVSKGQSIKMRTPIGKIYTDVDAGSLTKMEFQVWQIKSGSITPQKLNPEQWLKR